MANNSTICLAAAGAAGLFLAASANPPDASAQGGGRGGSGAGSAGTAAPSGLGRSGGSVSPSLTSPSTRAPGGAVAPSTAAPSGLGTAAPSVGAVAPLAPPTTSTFLGTGTTVTPFGEVPSTVGTTATFPGSGGGAAAAAGSAKGSGSASESAPSTPGGGGDGVTACMGFWDAGTHMNKREWAAACRRVTNRLDNLKPEAVKQAPRARTGGARNR